MKKEVRLSRFFKLMLSILCISLLVGCNTQNANENNASIQKECVSLAELPKNGLSMYANFKILKLPVYVAIEEPYIEFSLELSDIGKKYMKTGLFIEDYIINLVIKDVDTGEVFTSFDNISWKAVDEKKDIQLKIEMDDTTKEQLEKKLKLIEKKEYKVSFSVDIVPTNDSSTMISEIGFLEMK